MRAKLAGLFVLSIVQLFAVLMFSPTVSAQQSPIASIDNVTGQTVSGSVLIVGYARIPNAQGRLDIWLNGAYFAAATYGASRSDIPSDPNCGFTFELDTTTLANGPLVVEAKAYNTPSQTLFSDVSVTLTVANPVTYVTLEQPAAGAAVSGTSLQVSGWALTSGGFQGLEVMIDGRSAGTLAYGTIARPDVAKAYPQFQTTNSGFQGAVDISTLAQGFHEILMVTTSTAGTRRVGATTYINLNQNVATQGTIESPAPGSTISVGATLPISGWVAGNRQLSQVTVKLNDRVVGQTTSFNVRKDIQSTVPQYGYAQGFQLEVPALYVGTGKQKLEVISTDVNGNSNVIDRRSGQPNSITVKNTNHILGAFLRPANSYTASISTATADLGQPLDIVMYFAAMVQANGQPQTLTSAYPYLARQIKSQQAIPMLTYDTFQQGSGGTNTPALQPNFVLDAINAGTYDSDIISFANEVKNYGETAQQMRGGLTALPGQADTRGTILIRLDHEMAAGYYTWGGAYSTNSPQKYIQAWRHIIALFEQQGATNVRWIWAPDNASPPSTPAPDNDFENYYPGDGYVDYIGVSGYNWGNDPTYGTGWMTPEIIYGNFLSTIGRYQPRKSLIVSEIGCAPSYGSNSESAWITDVFGVLSANAQVKGIVWFDDQAFSTPTGLDFRVTNTPGLPSSDPLSISAFRTQAKIWRSTQTLIPASH